MAEERPLYTLYKNLKAQNYDVPEDYDKFESAMTRDGKAGADNRHAIYENLKAQNYDVPDNYERFYSALFEPRSKDSSRAKGGSVPMSEADKTRFILGANNIAYQGQQTVKNVNRYNNLKQRKRKQQNDFGRVNIGAHQTPYGGDANNVLKDEGTGQYVTSDGENTNNLAEAQEKQAGLDEYGKAWNDAVQSGAVPSALDEADPSLTPIDVEKKQADREAEYISSLFAPFIDEAEKDSENPFYDLNRGGIGGLTHNAATGNGLLTDEKARKLIAASNQNAQRRRLLELEQDTQNGSTWDNHSFWRGFADAVKDVNFWTGGISNMFDAGSLLATKQDLDNGKRTTVGDVLLRASVNNTDTQSKYGDNTSWVHDGGMITANMLPFIAKIASAGWSEAASQGIGKVVQGVSGNMAKGAMKKAAGVVGMNAAKNIGKFTGLTAKAFGKALQYGIIGASQANTMGMSNIGADVMGRYTGQVYQNENGDYKFGTFDSDGNLVHEGGEDFLTSLVKGELAQTTEFATELAGGSIDAVGRYLAKGGKNILDKFGMKNVTKYISGLFNNRVTRAVDRTLGKVEVNSIIGESMEEELGIIANSIFTGDNQLSDLWDKKQQAQIWGGMFLSIGLMKATLVPFHSYSAAQYYRYKHKVDVADANLSQILGKDKWESLRDRIDATSNDDMPNLLLEVLRDESLGGNRSQVGVYIKNLLTMRGYDIGTMLNAQTAVEDIAATDMAQNQAYQQGRNAEGADTHEIQIDQADKQRSLAELLGITEQQLSAMSSEELDAFTGQNDNLDRAIYEYQLSNAKYQGVIDNANDKVDMEAQRAASMTDMITDKSRGTVRNATIKATQGANDYGVYITNGNIATHDDGTIDISGSDQMIIYYDPQTGKVEHADASRFAALGDENPAEEVKAQAVADAKEKAIREVSGIIDGRVEVGTQFNVTGADGIQHTYEVLADNGDGTAMVTLDGNVEQNPYSFEDLQNMKDMEDQKLLEAAKAQREQMEAEREQKKADEEQRQAQSENHLRAQYNNLLDDDGKVVMGTVHDGKHDDQQAFIVGVNQSNKKPYVVFLNEDGTFTKPRSFKNDQVEIGESVDFETFKAMMPEIAVEEETPAADNATATAVEDNGGESAVNENEQNVTTAEENVPTEQVAVPSFEDGTPIPVDAEGEVDLSQTDAVHAAEWYDNNLGEDADDYLSGEISKAKNTLSKAQNIKVKGNKPSELVASKQAKEAAIADAQARLESAISIRDAYNERQLAKEEGTPEGRKNLIEKAKAKFARLKNKEGWKNQTGALWNETVGKVQHRLYDGLGVNVFDHEPQTVEEYVSSSIAPYSLNYEGTETSKGVKQETGLQRKDFAKSHVLAAEGKGVTVDDFVHKLWDNRPSQFENVSDQEIRNALLDLITSDMNAYDMQHVIENNRIAQAEKEIEDEKNAADNAKLSDESAPSNTENEAESAAADSEQSFPDKLRQPSQEGTTEVPDGATGEKPLGEQKSEEELPFSVKNENKQETPEERAASVEKNRVDDKDMDLVDTIIGKKMRKSLARIAKMMGAKIQYQYTDKLGNGWYDNKTNTIYLTLDSSLTKGVQFIFGHEMTHEIKSKNAEAFEELAQLVKDGYGKDFDKAVDAMVKRYSDAGLSGYERAYYEEEVIADGIGEMIRDLNLAHSIALKMSHPLLAKIHEILLRIKRAFTGTEYPETIDNIIRSIEQAYIQTANREAVNTATQEGEGGQRFSIRTKEAPKKTQKVFKLMRLNPAEEGKLFPLFIGSGEAVELGKWYDADSPKLQDLKSLSSKDFVGTRSVTKDGKKVKEEYNYGAYLVNNETGEAMSLADFKAKYAKEFARMGNNPNVKAVNWATDNGYRWIKIEEKNQGQSRYGGENRSYYNYGINGTGSVSVFAMRPGWHAGSLPTMRQIGKGSAKNLRDDTFVWVEGEIPADIDYNEEAQRNADKDIPDHIPTDGFYLKATNANKEASQADKVGWYVAGAFKPNRIMSDKETRDVIDQWNAEHPDDDKVEYDWKRESGKDFNAETMRLERFSLKEANDRFNNEIEDFKNKSHKGLMHLGTPSPILKACGMNADEITLSPKVLNKKLNQHSLTSDDVKDLVNAIQKPIMVYKHGENKPNIVVITNADVRGNKLSLALELDADGNVTEMNNVSSVHDKEAETEVNRWLSWDEGYLESALRWVDKEKVSDWLSSARLISYSQTEYNQKLSSVAKILNSFENPKVSDEKNQYDAKFSLKVYHGSGADFTEFDFDHMGEGAGSQAFGWGGYVTSSKKIGKDYASIKYDPEKDVEYVGKNKKPFTDLIATLFDGGIRDYNYVKNTLLEISDNDKSNISKKEEYDWFVSTKPEDWFNPNPTKNRNLYEVNIPDDNGKNYLDWDKPLTDEQKKIIYNGLVAKNIKNPDLIVNAAMNVGPKLVPSLQAVYDDLSKSYNLNGIQNASQFLSSLGYTGIKYKAGRYFGGAEEGDTNYVIFKPEDMQIAEHTKFSLKDAKEKLSAYGTLSEDVTDIADLPTDMAYRETDINELKDLLETGYMRSLPEGKVVEGADHKVNTRRGRSFQIGKVYGQSHGGKGFAKGAPWSIIGGTLSTGTATKVIIGVPGNIIDWQVGHHNNYSEPQSFDEIEHGRPLWVSFDEDGDVTDIRAEDVRAWVADAEGNYHEFIPSENDTPKFSLKSKPVRFEVGKSLSEDEKKEVLSTLKDAYKVNSVPYHVEETANGKEKRVYEPTADDYVVSDITNRPLRYYITLPDGRVAHPSEVYPNISDHEVKSSAEKQGLADSEAEEMANKAISKMYDANVDAKKALSILNELQKLPHETNDVGYGLNNARSYNYKTGVFTSDAAQAIDYVVRRMRRKEEVSDDVVKAVKKAGIDVRTYEGKEDREKVTMDAVNNSEDIRFSLAGERGAVNDKFNADLDRYVKGEMKSSEMLYLGNPSGVMANFLPNLPVVMRTRILNKASNTKHNVEVSELKNLPLRISEPIFVFKRSDNALGVLTEIKDRDGLNVCVAIELGKTIQDGGDFLEVNDIRSIHGRNAANLIEPIVHNNTLVYADKEKGLAWLSSASYNYQQEIDKQDLNSAAKIVKDFENPKEKGEKIDSDQSKFSLKDEKEKIVADAQKNGTYMLAPNGKKTNLDAEQWASVRTDNFKKWFGDWERDPKNASTVVDENGEPMVVYHGRSADFNTFEKKEGVRFVMGLEDNVQAEGFFFTPDKGLAEEFAGNAARHRGGKANIVPCFLNIKKPMDLTGEDFARIYEDVTGWNYMVGMDTQDNLWGIMDEEGMADKIKSKGYDGAIFVEEVDGSSEPAKISYCALDANQIKSADNNNGEYSDTNNDIRFSLAGEQGATAADDVDRVTTRMDNLQIAQAMEEAKKDAKAIKLATGWERGADGKWRYEIPDFQFNYDKWRDNNKKVRESISDKDYRSLMRYTYDFYDEMSPVRKKNFDELRRRTGYKIEEELTLGDVLDGNGAKNLFKYYPELRDVKFEYANLGAYTIGSFDPETNTIKVNQSFMYNPRMTRLNLLHEVQHAIQRIEGFARGGSENAVRNDMKKKLDEVTKQIKQLKAEGKTDEAKALIDKDKGLYNAYANEKDDFKNYQALAGEVEARNVQTRMGMTDEERRNSLASETEDVAREDQIFLEQDDTKFSIKQFGTDVANASDRIKNLMDNEKIISRRIGSRAQAQNRVLDTLSRASDEFRRSNRASAKSGQDTWEKDRALGHVVRASYGTGSFLTEEEIKEITSGKVGSGQENQVFLSKDGKTVFKLNNLLMVDKEFRFNEFLDRIKAHNEFAPEDMYTPIGFALNEEGDFCVVLEQPYVQDSLPATQEEIDDYMEEHGYDLCPIRVSADEVGAGWSNGEFEIWDTKPRNVLKDKNGDLHFIDTVIQHTFIDGHNDKMRFSLRVDQYQHDLAQWKKDNNLPKDAERPSIPVREPNETAVDFAKRVKEYRKQMALWMTAPQYEDHLLTSDTAQGQFNLELQRGSVLARIALQDSMLAIRKAQEAIMKEVGVDRLNIAEDAYTAENRSHGKGKNEFEEYNDEFLQPLRKSYNKMMKSLGNSYDNVKVYMMAKHGLERNAHIAFKKALDNDFEKQEERVNAYNAYKADMDRMANNIDFENGKIDFTTWRRKDNAIRAKYAPSYLEYRYDKMGITQDYSGLSALFEGSDFEEAAAELVKDVETRFVGDTNELWYNTNAATKKILRDSYKADMMTKDVYEFVRGMYDHYIPLRGWGDTNADQVWNYMGGGKGAFNQTLKKANGRKSLADDPIAYIENMAESGILMNNKNWVKQHLLLLAENHPTSLLTVSKAWYIKTVDAQGNEEWIPASPNITANMTSQQVRNELEAFEKKMEQMKQKGDATQKREHLEISYPQTKGEEREHEVRVMRDGEEYVIYVNGDPQLAQAMNNTRAHRVREGLENSISQKVLAWIGRKMAAAYTSLSPLFIPSNYFRDSTMTLASTAIREDRKYNWLLWKNMATHWNTFHLVLSYQNGTLREKVRDGKASETEQMFYDFMMNGGETGFVSALDVEDMKKKFKNELKDMNRMSANPVKVGHVIMDSIETLNRAIEDSNRFMVYMTSIQYGRSIDEAVNDAKDVTLNFNRKGTGEHGWQTIRNLYLFINPAVQSLQTLGALAKHHPFKFTAVTTAWLASGMLVPMINNLMMEMFGGDDDKDKYWSFTKWDRRNNFIMWVPFTHNFIKIPLAQEFRSFYGVGDMIASKLYGGEKAQQSWEEYGMDMLGQVVDMLPLDPTGYDGNIAVSLMPNPIRPFFELAFNVDFTGKPLFKDSEYNKYDPNFTKAYAGTPDWLVRISRMVNSVGNDYPDFQQNAFDKFGNPRFNLNNPAVLHHVLSSYLGGAYTMGSQILGVATKALNGDEVKMADVPLASKFVGNPDDRPASKKQGDEFWTTKERHARAARLLSQLKKKAKVDGDYSTLDVFFGSDEYKQYLLDDKVVKKYEEDRKKERAEESGDEYKPHKTTYADIYKSHATPKDDFEDLKLSQLYNKVKDYNATWKAMLDMASSQAGSYYDENVTAIQAAWKAEKIIGQMNDIKKKFLSDKGEDAWNAEGMKKVRDLRKQAIPVLEKANKVLVERQKAKANKK